MSKDKLKKAIKAVVKILKKKNPTIHKELQFLVDFFFFAAKVVYPGQAFFQHFYNRLAKDGNNLH